MFQDWVYRFCHQKMIVGCPIFCSWLNFLTWMINIISYVHNMIYFEYFLTLKIDYIRSISRFVSTSIAPQKSDCLMSSIFLTIIQVLFDIKKVAEYCSLHNLGPHISQQKIYFPYHNNYSKLIFLTWMTWTTKYHFLCHQWSVKNYPSTFWHWKLIELCLKNIQVLFDIENWLNIVHYMIGFLTFRMQKLLLNVVTVVSDTTYILLSHISFLVSPMGCKKLFKYFLTLKTGWKKLLLHDLVPYIWFCIFFF